MGGIGQASAPVPATRATGSLHQITDRQPPELGATSAYTAALPLILKAGQIPQYPSVRLRYEFRITPQGGHTWIAIPQESTVQHNVVLKFLSLPPANVYTDPTFGNAVLYYTNPQQEITGTLELSTELPRSFYVDEDRIPAYDRSADLFKLYTRSEYWIEADVPEIVSLAQTIVGHETNPFIAARMINDYVGTHISKEAIPWTGDHAQYRNEYGALATLRRGSGSCQNQALVFVALSRAAGIPARVVHGINSAALDTERNLEDWSHAWAEFWLPEYGWIAADPIGELFAEIDNLRVVLSHGSNVPLDPPCPYQDQLWYCYEGNATHINYPMPYSDLHFLLTRLD
jgi:hypothetical protein